MQDIIDAPLDINEIGNIMANELEMRIAKKMGKIVGVPCNKIVNADNFVSFLQKSVAEM